MAVGRSLTPLSFMFEKDVVTVFARVTWDAGSPTIDPNNSKGIANFWKETIAFTGGVVNSTTSIGTVTSFLGLYTGMAVTGAGVATGNLIGSTLGASNSITMTKQNITTANGVSLFANGGRYRVQFGKVIGSSSATPGYDTYVKLLGWDANWDMTSGSASGTANSSALAPAAQQMFITGSSAYNNVTIPRTAVSGSTDASLVLQFGNGAGTSFAAADPANGEALNLTFYFGKTTAK